MPHAADAIPIHSRLTLRVKLTLWFLAIALLIQLTLSTVVLIYHRRWLDGFFSERLDQWAVSMAARISSSAEAINDESLAAIGRLGQPTAPTEPITLVLYDEEGRTIASTVDAPPRADRVRVMEVVRDSRPRAFRAKVPELPGVAGEDPTSRLVVRPIRLASGQDCVLLVCRSDITYETMAGVMFELLMSTIPVGMFAAGVAAWFVSSMTLAPLAQLRRLAGALSPDRLEAEPESATHLTPDLAPLEAELRATRAKLLMAFRAQDRFISSVSHELKTPISVLLAESQTLRTDNLSDEAKSYVKSVVEEIRRLGRMIESFLMLTHLRGGRVLENGRRCAVNEVVLEAVANCRGMSRQYAVTLLPSLDEGEPELILWGEPELLRVMIDNLLRNAIRFSPQGAKVHIDVRGEAGHAVILVRDAGPGVPGDMIDRIFDQFVQAPEESKRARGYGLGLSIAQGVAELHSGSISVRNLPEGGCEFRVVLPLIGPSSGTRAEDGTRRPQASSESPNVPAASG